MLSSLNAVISTNESTGFITGHVIYNLAYYTYKFQLKTTYFTNIVKEVVAKSILTGNWKGEVLKWRKDFNLISTCKDVQFIANVKDISFRLKTTMIDNGNYNDINSYFCPKYLTINMNNTIFQSERITDRVSVNNSKVYSAYQKSVATTNTDHVVGKLVWLHF